MAEDKMKTHRDFLKDYLRMVIDFSKTDQNKGIATPPLQKPYDPDAKRIALPDPETCSESVQQNDFATLVAERVSKRRFKDEALSLSELGFLLWATQGIRQQVDQGTAFRTVPSAGCRHAFETYLAVSKVDGLDTGIYRYLPVKHELLFVGAEDNLEEKLTGAAIGQRFVGRAPVTFIWTAVPYRMEWRYGLSAHRVIALDAGHVCQNLYLAAGAIGGGACAIAAYNQDLMNELIDVDGEDEFTIYLAPVGKV